MPCISFNRLLSNRTRYIIQKQIRSQHPQRIIEISSRSSRLRVRLLSDHGLLRNRPPEEFHQVQHFLLHPGLPQSPGELQMAAGVGGYQEFGVGVLHVF